MNELMASNVVIEASNFFRQRMTLLLVLLAGHDAEEAEAQNQAAQHGAVGEPPARLGDALRGTGGSGARKRRRQLGGGSGEAAAAQRAASETANAVRYG